MYKIKMMKIDIIGFSETHRSNIGEILAHKVYFSGSDISQPRRSIQDHVFKGYLTLIDIESLN